MNTISVGVVGCGSRGSSLIRDLLVSLPGCRITAVCDDFGDRAERSAADVKERTGIQPAALKDYGDLLARSDVDAVLIVSPWETHIPFAIRAMEAGKPCAIEVGGATSVQECFDLVRTWERTRTPFMFLENCCFGRTELAVTNAVRRGLFGRIVHCDGAYSHDLREEIEGGDRNHHYRLRHYLKRNGENYPTHELGPIAKLLDVNHGNRILSLTSTASLAAGLNEYGVKGPVAQGDVVTTVLKLAGGETVRLSLDTTLPRWYCRDFTVRGTRGMYEERTNSYFIDGVHEDHFDWRPNWNNAEPWLSAMEHPIWERFLRDGVLGGHGGMDGLVYGAFLRCLRLGLPMPIDVYDAAAWMAVTPLSEASIAQGSAPVAFPDFTHGEWVRPGDPIAEYAATL